MFRIRHFHTTLVHSQKTVAQTVNSLLSSLKFQEAQTLLESSHLSSADSINVFKHCFDVRHKSATKLAMQLGQMSLPTASFTSLPTLLYFFLRALTQNRDLQTLRDLRGLGDDISLTSNTDSPPLHALYYSVYILTYINLAQPVLALEVYLNVFNHLSETYPDMLISHQLPTIRLLNLLLEFRDTAGINKILEIVHTEESIKSPSKSIITRASWLLYLSQGCSCNDYELVKNVYDSYLMKGFNQSSNKDEILFNRELVDLFAAKGIDELVVYLILHTLSTHGDTGRALALIESFYIHRVLAGEKAFTKDLFVMVVEAYCSAENDEIHLIDPRDFKDFHDSSMERVLDVVGSFLNRANEKLSYKDISQYLSYKFMNYKAYDKNIDFKLTKTRLSTNQKLETDKASLKSSNTNISASPFGNILANLQVLDSFTRKHIEYIKSRNLPLETITLFVNCILNHINLYQNFSAIISVLKNLQSLDPDFLADWLNSDLMDIILHSMANSTGCKLCSLHLFKYLRSRTKLTHFQYYCFISSILRGDFYVQLKYYLYFYIKDLGSFDIRTKQLINDLPLHVRENMDLELQQLIEHQLIMGIQNEEPAVTAAQLPNFNREYLPEIDKRDYAYFSRLF